MTCGVLLGCGARQPAQSGEDPVSSGAIVVKGSDLSGPLLESLRGRVPNMTISRPVGSCPHVVFRGSRSIRNQGNPSVYIDGTLVHDTCILDQIVTSDIDYVELYPSGNTARPEIQRNPFGLILIYRRQE